MFKKINLKGKTAMATGAAPDINAFKVIFCFGFSLKYSAINSFAAQE